MVARKEEHIAAAIIETVECHAFAVGIYMGITQGPLRKPKMEDNHIY